MRKVYENDNYKVVVRVHTDTTVEAENKYYVVNKDTSITDAAEDNYPDAVTIADYMDFLINNDIFDVLIAKLYEEWGIPVPKSVGGPLKTVVPGDFGKH